MCACALLSVVGVRVIVCQNVDACVSVGLVRVTDVRVYRGFVRVLDVWMCDVCVELMCEYVHVLVFSTMQAHSQLRHSAANKLDVYNSTLLTSVRRARRQGTKKAPSVM